MCDEMDFTECQMLNGGCTWAKDLYHNTLTFTSKATPFFEW